MPAGSLTARCLELLVRVMVCPVLCTPYTVQSDRESSVALIRCSTAQQTKHTAEAYMPHAWGLRPSANPNWFLHELLLMTPKLTVFSPKANQSLAHLSNRGLL